MREFRRNLNDMMSDAATEWLHSIALVSLRGLTTEGTQDEAI
jgi:hypothetical protein